MSLRSDGTYHCDRCGTAVGNGSVHEAVIAVGMNPDRQFETVQYHWCLAACAPLVLTGDALADWNANRVMS